jgi:hypothetical protein
MSTVQQVVFNIDIAAGVIGIIAMVTYFWADHKEQKEIAELLKKSGIDTIKDWK